MVPPSQASCPGGAERGQARSGQQELWTAHGGMELLLPPFAEVVGLPHFCPFPGLVV